MNNELEPITSDEDIVLVRKPRKGIYVLPNLFTLAALFGGFGANPPLQERDPWGTLNTLPGGD